MTLSDVQLGQVRENNGWTDDCLPLDPVNYPPDNPPMWKIVEYLDLKSELVHGVVFVGERNADRYDVDDPPYRRHARVIWERQG